MARAGKTNRAKTKTKKSGSTSKVRKATSARAKKPALKASAKTETKTPSKARKTVVKGRTQTTQAGAPSPVDTQTVRKTAGRARKSNKSANGEKKAAAPKRTLAPKASPAETIAERIAARLREKENGGAPKRRGRRGRRPKNLTDYTPTHSEDGDFNGDVDYQGLEYDTGISVNRADDDMFSLDYEDFEKELNFDP